jgi:hypothetical protein
VKLWERLFGKKSKEEIDPLHDLTLSALKVGYMLDYDLKTWEVRSYHTYNFDGDLVEEWELDSGDDQCYLERAKDDKVEWAMTRKLPFSDLGEGIPEHIRQHEDPPKEVIYQDTRFSLEEGGAGYYYRDAKGTGEEMIYWDYIDASGERSLSIEQWGEDEFEASVGHSVQEYQFTNILPREKE